jgi:hypothetical protein
MIQDCREPAPEKMEYLQLWKQGLEPNYEKSKVGNGQFHIDLVTHTHCIEL